MKPVLPQSARKVWAAAQRLGIETEIREMDDSTRTAHEAAVACGCSVVQIVKSLVFRGENSGVPFLFLVSGVNRVDEMRVGEAVGEALTRPDADYVREITGFAIGGIPPFGHAREMATYMDEDLTGHETIWAAAGTPRCVMRLNPVTLSRAIGARIIAVK